MTRLPALLALSLFAAPLPVLAQQILPTQENLQNCKGQSVVAESMISFTDAVHRWGARAERQHGEIWRHWERGIERVLYQTDPGNGIRYVAAGRPCRLLLGPPSPVSTP